MQPNDYFSDFDDLFERMTQNRQGVFGRHHRPVGVDDPDFAVDVATTTTKSSSRRTAPASRRTTSTSPSTATC